MVWKMRRKVTLSVALLAIGGLAEARTPTVARRQSVSAAPAKTAKPAPASRLVRPKPPAQPASPATVPPRASAPRAAPRQFAQLDEFLPVQAGPDELNVEVPAAKEAPTAEIPAAEEPADGVPSDELNLDEPRIDEPLPASNSDPSRNEAPPAQSDSTETLPPPEATNAPAATGGIFRLEPPNKLVPVASNELKPGVIYLHDSPTLGRQVWSFLQADHQFWHAFGPGTTQSVDHFDLRMTSEERKEALKKIDPKLAFDVSDTGAKVYLRLESDNTWKLVRINSVPSIYDLETSQRWEKQWDRYLPVMHNCGDTWQRLGDRYEAAGWVGGTFDRLSPGKVGPSTSSGQDGWDEGTIEQNEWTSE